METGIAREARAILRPVQRIGPAVVLLAALAACGQRGTLPLDPAAASVGTPERVIVATTRKPQPEAPYFGEGRSYTTAFGEFTISVPPDRKPGSVRFARDDRMNPDRDFLLTAYRPLDGLRGFTRELDRRLAAAPARHRHLGLFVHGYNTNFSEGLARQAQLQHDLDYEGVSVQFAWPSAAKGTEYLYDRESVLFSRDALAETLQAMADSRAPEFNLFAHSMGTFLLMESLSQMARLGYDRVFDKLNAVVLISADEEIDVFRKQAPPVLARGVKIYLLVSDKDRALEVSSRIRGEHDRLGSIRSRAELGGLDVTVIDVSQVKSSTFMGHLKEGESPAMIDFVDKLHAEDLDAFDGDIAGSLLQGGVSLIQQGLNIVTAPLALQ